MSQVFARFMQRALNLQTPLNPEHITVAGGCSALLEILAYSLADPGQGFLHPSPIYPG
jgi:DNA-binding transcriptional MocR family regulator